VARKLNAALRAGRLRAAKQALDGLHHEPTPPGTGAARSPAEGLEETLTVHRLHVPQQLRMTLANTNVIESASPSSKAGFAFTVKRWYPGDARERWVGSGPLVAEKQFRVSRDTTRSPFFSQSWMLSSPCKSSLRSGERHRRVSYSRAATFNGSRAIPLLNVASKRRNPLLVIVY